MLQPALRAEKARAKAPRYTPRCHFFAESSVVSAAIMKTGMVGSKSARGCSRAVAVAAGALLFVSSVQIAGAVPVTLEAGVAIVETSGLRRYAAQRFLTENRTSSLAAPQLRVSMPVGDSWVVGAGYGYYATLRGHGVSPSSDVFDDGGSSLQVVTPFSSEERIHEATLDVRYRLPLSAGVAVEVGPTLSWFYSRATIWNRSFTADDVRLGGAINFLCPINERWAVHAGYRYAAPPDRTLHMLVLTASRSF